MLQLDCEDTEISTALLNCNTGDLQAHDHSPLGVLKDGKAPFINIVVSHTPFTQESMITFLGALKAAGPQPPVTQSITFNFADLDDDACLLLLQHAMQCPMLTAVELFGNRIGDKSCQVMAELLKSRKLQRLKLGDNCIQDIGAVLLSEGLKENSSLLQLHLGNNRIGDVGVQALALALDGNTSLTSLGLRDNHFGPTGISYLAKLLSCQCSITDLHLKGNRIGNVGAWHISGAIKNNKSLHVLELPATHLQAEDAKVLADGLKSNHCIHAVNLNDNNIVDEGTEALMEMLHANTTISTLGLRGNAIGPRGGQAIAAVLQHNMYLTGLDMGANAIGSQGAVAFADALRVNQHLISLDLHANSIQLQGILQLASAMACNGTLRHLDMGSNFSGNQGASEWANALRKNTSLTRLSLTDNGISDPGGADLLSALQQNRTLRYFGIGGQSERPPFGNQLSTPLRKAIRQQLIANNAVHMQAAQRTPSSSSRSSDSMDGGALASPSSGHSSLLTPTSSMVSKDSPLPAAEIHHGCKAQRAKVATFSSARSPLAPSRHREVLCSPSSVFPWVPNVEATRLVHLDSPDADMSLVSKPAPSFMSQQSLKTQMSNLPLPAASQSINAPQVRHVGFIHPSADMGPPMAQRPGLSHQPPAKKYGQAPPMRPAPVHLQFPAHFSPSQTLGSFYELPGNAASLDSLRNGHQMSVFSVLTNPAGQPQLLPTLRPPQQSILNNPSMLPPKSNARSKHIPAPSSESGSFHKWQRMADAHQAAPPPGTKMAQPPRASSDVFLPTTFGTPKRWNTESIEPSNLEVWLASQGMPPSSQHSSPGLSQESHSADSSPDQSPLHTGVMRTATCQIGLKQKAMSVLSHSAPSPDKGLTYYDKRPIPVANPVSPLNFLSHSPHQEDPDTPNFDVAKIVKALQDFAQSSAGKDAARPPRNESLPCLWQDHAP